MKGTRKTIAIIDCFVHNDSVKEKLVRSIVSLRKIGIDILLITNTRISDDEILESIDYLIYVSKNNLFEGDYNWKSTVNYWTVCDGFTVNIVESEKQRHGLSVLINMLASLKFCYNLGYTHFHRLEVDSNIGEQGFEFIRDIDRGILKGEMDGVIYVNERSGTRWEGGNISFQYMSLDIKTLIENFPPISSEDDYRKFLLEKNGNLDFMIAEDFIYEIIKNKTSPFLTIKDGKSQMDSDFSNSLWNTSTSPSIDSNFEGCATRCYRKIDSNENYIGMCVYSKNMSGDNITRRIRIVKSDGSDLTITQNTPGLFHWVYNDIPEDSSLMEIYSESGKLLHSEEIAEQKVLSFIKFN